MSKLTALGAAALLSLAGAAHAQTMPANPSTPTPAELTEAFKKADKNGDGKLSKPEASAVRGWAEKFDAADVDKDGFLSMDEYMAAATKP